MALPSPGNLDDSFDVQHPLVPTSSCFKCPLCNPGMENARNLVVCIDGTSDQFGPNNTNVVKLFTKIDLESTHPEQFGYYSSGFGTRPESLDALGRIQRTVYDKVDMALVRNIGENVKDAYTWLAQMYREGDQIYLFGFSRGAYQVQVLAEMIHKVGLLKAVTTGDQVGKAYEHYEGIRQGKQGAVQTAKEFKKAYSEDVRTHFVGIWDSVSSVGLTGEDVFLSTSSLVRQTCHLRHALALDELRVKFMPSYFHQVNSLTDLSGRGGEISNVKEVWFAGSHSDIGGKSRPGEFRNAGSVSLLWMRREATAQGLVLKPTDIVWLPDDIDSGVSDSMTVFWRALEYMPIKHQVSVGGTGETARCLHRLQPRRIIPGQKIHASILCAYTYQPKASLGKGFDIPIVHFGFDDMELDDQIWETGLFDDTAAQELMLSLDSRRGVAPIYLDRLLFMLRFKEGKRHVRNVSGWQDRFMRILTGDDHLPLVRLVATIACHEVSCDLDNGCSSPLLELSQDIFRDAKECLRNILAAHKHRDRSRIVTLLGPLTKHQILQGHMLSSDILEAFMKLFDTVIRQPTQCFQQAMDGLICLLQCVSTRQCVTERLGANLSSSGESRLSRILEVDDMHLLTAALRMTLTLSRIPQARIACTMVKSRIKELASRDSLLVGPLAIQIWLTLYYPNGWDQLNIYDAHVRANFVGALVRLILGSAGDQDHFGDPGRCLLSHLFRVDAMELSDSQKKLVQVLKMAVEKGNVRERTAATMTLLKLCEDDTSGPQTRTRVSSAVIIRTYLRDIHLLDVFVRQMRRKDSALLAAYALATYLKYNMESISDNQDFPKHIFRMLALDYFDDAVGRIEGFQVFRDLMQHAELRQEVAKYDILGVLETKLGKGKPKDIRTSLLCLEIFRSFDPGNFWARELVNNSLQNLRNREWKAQKVGVKVLYALAQTEHGVAVVSPCIPEIVEMLLPAGYLLIRPTRATTDSSPLSSEGGSQAGSTNSLSTISHDPPPRPPSWMMGPACALRILAQNETLRDRIRESVQYRYLKDLFLSGALVDKKDTPAWRIKTARRANVINMLYKMIFAVDDGVFEQGLVSLKDALPPLLRHSSRLMTLLHNRSVAVVTILSALLGVPILAILAAVVYTPIGASVRIYGLLRQMVSRYGD